MPCEMGAGLGLDRAPETQMGLSVLMAWVTAMVDALGVAGCVMEWMQHSGYLMMTLPDTVEEMATEVALATGIMMVGKEEDKTPKHPQQHKGEPMFRVACKDHSHGVVLRGVLPTIRAARRYACIHSVTHKYGQNCYEIRDGLTGVTVERIRPVNHMECIIEWQQTPDVVPDAVAALIRVGSKGQTL